MYQFFQISDDIRKPWIALCGDPRMEILAGDQAEVHIAACLGLGPLVQLAIKCAQPEVNIFQQLLTAGRGKTQIMDCIPISQCTPSLLIDLDKNATTSSKLDTRESTFLRFRPFNQKGFNKKNRSGDTPLHLAFQLDDMDMVELLLKEGADPTIENNAGLTASELGAKLGRKYILEETGEGTVVVVPVEGPERRL
ncbi:hypothetical protein B9Z19DRAFT_1086627 [Tuber borchii]|uniref:Uncharacterized protein n=1 Tax=Tuber borchii TaxID=42251 RepID=A0A2T6ZP23_TUBBO|nr:hypothetical protein B9Z19DRAFT_1086627 [Tuber borchii]